MGLPRWPPGARVITLGPVARQLFDHELGLMQGPERRAGREFIATTKIIGMKSLNPCTFREVVHGVTIQVS